MVAAGSRYELPHVPVAVVDRKSNVPPGVLIVVLVVDDVVVLDVELVVGTDVDVLVLDDVLVELLAGTIELVVLELVLDDVVLLDVVDGPPVVVVVDDVGLHAAGSGPTIPGTDAAPAPSASKSATQSTQSTIDAASTIAPPQLDAGKNGFTAGQLDVKPTSDGVVSPAPLHWPSAPPQARQITARFFASAFAICVAALPSPGLGHGFACWPRSRASQHFSIAFARFPR